MNTVSAKRQYLTFTLDNELFALDIFKVREVIEFAGVTKVPDTPDFMRGVINMRGGVVPVMDLKLKLGKAMTHPTVNTCTIIMEVKMDGETTILGALADSVEDVIDLTPEETETAPTIGIGLDNDFIQGMGKQDGELFIILDIDKILSREQSAHGQELDNRNAPIVMSTTAMPLT